MISWIQQGDCGLEVSGSHGEVNTGLSVLSRQSVSMPGQLLAKILSTDANKISLHAVGVHRE